LLITVRLDRDTEASLSRLAGRTGRSRSALVRDAIRRLAEEEPAPARSAVPTFAERIAPYVGSVDTGGGQLSERSGERVRQILGERAGSRRSAENVEGPAATRPAGPRGRPQIAGRRRRASRQ